MVDVLRMPENSFGSVPTPALVAPLEFTLPLADFERLGGHMGSITTLEGLARSRTEMRMAPWSPENPWPLSPIQKQED